MLVIAIAFVTLLFSSIPAEPAGVKASNISFGPAGQYHGYLSRPSGPGKFPGLVVIQEWWGINDNVRNESRKLAESGYVARAVDLFGKTTTDPRDLR